MARCEMCSRQVRLPMNQQYCFDCNRRHLETQLLSRSDSQRRNEYQTPQGHTLPQVTMPLMNQPVPTPTTVNTQIIQPQVQQITAPESKIDELKRKIEELKNSIGK